MGVLAGKVAVVTGSGRGIGRALALRLAKEGARVVVNNRSPNSPRGSAGRVADEIRAANGEAVAIFADIASAEGSEQVIQAAIDSFGRIDILVNNAGLMIRNFFWEMTETEWDEVIRVHLKGTFLCSAAAARVMKEQRSGCIVNISSRIGIYGRPGTASYAAAKAGIIGLSSVMAAELAPYKIRVNCICPSATTGMSSTPEELARYGTPDYLQGRGAKERPPEAVAPLIVYLAGDWASEISGKVFYIGGGDISIYSPSQAAWTRHKEGIWEVDELHDLLPSVLG